MNSDRLFEIAVDIWNSAVGVLLFACIIVVVLIAKWKPEKKEVQRQVLEDEDFIDE